MSGPIGISGAPPETELDVPSPEAVAALDEARGVEGSGRRGALAAVVRSHPEWSEAWAELGASSDDVIEAYAYFRVGYHRGLDALRKAGWRGSGYVRWSVPANRGFLRCVDGLRAMAAAIGEEAEAERCAVFLRQLDPTWTGADPP